MTAGAALLARLKALGVDYVLANAGTDFPPLIEGIAEAQARGIPLPEALVIPHEHAAMGMAHGYFLATGRPQAVMAHTNVGLANCVIGAINAAAERIPMLLFSGRTPVTERGRFGSRSIPIGWGQEMRDQAGMLRELTKWDYELRFPEQVAELADRAYAIACSSPQGPVYMSLPREVLCEPFGTQALAGPPSMAPTRQALRPEDVRTAADLLAGARRPLILAQHGAGSAEAFTALQRLCEAWAIPVVQFWATRLALPMDHPMQAGMDPLPWIEEADLILVLDGLSPWMPDQHAPPAECRIVHAGPDPLYSRFPVRNFRSDLSLAAEVSEVILALETALARQARPQQLIEARREQIVSRTRALRAKVSERAAQGGERTPMSREWVSRCLAKAVAGRGAKIVNELGCPLEPMPLSDWDAFQDAPHSGGLGWGLPTALGIQLADRRRLVVATVGDGSYMFANPTACHLIAEAHRLPVLTLVINNAEWGAVRRSVHGLYPDGYAVRANTMPLTALTPSPDFTMVAAASRAYTQRVTEAKALPAALAGAIDHIETHRTQALLDIQVAA